MKKLLFILLLSPILVFSQSKKAKRWFDMGMDQYTIMLQSGNQSSWDGKLALSCFSSAIDKYPEYTEAYFMRGIIKSATISCYQAIEDYNEVIRLNPNYKEVYYHLGKCNETNGSYYEAIKYFTKGIELDKENSDNFHGRAISRSKIKDFDGAISDLNKAIKYCNKRNQILSGLYYVRAMFKLKSENYGAIDYCSDFKKAAELNPQYTTSFYCEKETEYYTRQGTSKISSNHYKGAIADYTYAILLNPDFVDAYYNRGNAYLKLGNYNNAISDYSRAIRIDPDYVDAYYNRGNAYMKMGNYNDAISDYSRAIGIDPDYVDAYYNRGNAYMKIGNYNDAISDYSRAIGIDPDYAKAYMNRGISKKALKDYKGAIADYIKVIEIDPDYAAAYRNRGIAKENAGLPYCSDYKKACDLGQEKCCDWYNNQCR